MDKQTDLISRLQDEADLCRNEGASDIAALLDEAVAALQAPRPEVAGDGSEAMQLSWVPLNRRNLDWHAHATVQLRAMHVALSTAQKTPRDPLEIEELWDEANELRQKYDEYGPEVYELFARLLERAHGIGVEHG